MGNSVEGISGCGKLCNCSFYDTKFACVGGEKKKKTEKENPSAIESHVTQQKKSARFIDTEVGGGVTLK